MRPIAADVVLDCVGVSRNGASSSSSSFYSSNNLAVRTSTSIQLRRAKQQGPTRTLAAALKRVLKQLLGTYSTTQVKQTNKKTRKINLFNAVPKTFKDVKFTVDGSAFQTFITHNFLLSAFLRWPKEPRNRWSRWRHRANTLD